ncbi:hypothetical protein C1I60_16185 [Paenibacillus terrae]|uniref:Uncharacterized protein n=1 Tax=Paenibacillus terrae TaxID=159743 RepID=A0A4U2PUF4_9BACL|nr:hypothetical protein [Paenibacillus terrae]TKH43057.1 hypothetical protein C1I60_16185 [Paenibacillus terrae]
MSKFTEIPDKLVRQLAKIKEIKGIRGKEIEEIEQEIIKAGHESDLEYLNDQLAFTGKISGLIIEKPIDAFPEDASNAANFITRLKENKLIPNDVSKQKNWFVEYNDEIKICGIKIEEESVFISTVEKKISTYQTGWNKRSPNEYAYFASLVFHFTNQLIEYRCPVTSVNKYKKFALNILGLNEKVECARLTKLTPADARKVKENLKGSYTSEQISIPFSVGSITFTRGKSSVDLDIDPLMVIMKQALNDVNVPTDDKLDVVCKLDDFIDQRTKVELPFSFEINLKSGGLKFKSGTITQGTIDHVVEAIIKVAFLDKQQDLAATI